MAKIERKYMAHYIDSTFGNTTPSWYRIGKDLEELNVELNPSVSIETDILGNEYVLHDGYAPSAEAETFYAESGDALFVKLQAIIDALDTDCETYMLEVHAWSGISTFPAVRQRCVVVPDSYGGDTSGYQIPFNIILLGDKVSGVFSNGTFVPNS